MKRKIVLSLLLLFLFFTVGAVLSTVYIRNTTTALERLIKLHQIENQRGHLIMAVQTVQSELYTVGTSLAHKTDVITESAEKMDEAAGRCTGCHHVPNVENLLLQLQSQIKDYQGALSRFITASANREEIDHMKFEAASIGNSLLKMSEQMSFSASTKLAAMTNDALSRARTVRTILITTMVLTLVFALIIAFRLTTSVTRPIEVLLNAARAIASGNLGYKVDYKDTTEFGELADNFNVMSSALKDGYAKLEEEIAERKQTESALVKSEAFLNTIFDSIHDPFCIFDRDYRIVRANAAYASLKSVEMDSMISGVCYRLLYGRDKVCDGCIVEKTFLSGDTCAKEKLISGGDGERQWLEIYTYPILDNDGTITHVIEYSRDITERKRAEEALKESEERYALAAKGANDGLWDWNLRDNKIYYSIRWKAMLGFDERELGDHPDEWFKRIHADEGEKVISKIRAHIRHSDQHFNVEYRIRHKDGTYRWMLCRGLAIRDKEGRVFRVAGSQTDITSRKQAEEQLLHDAFHDALTGLPNRALFRDRLQHAINSSKRIRQYLYAVMFLDVDRFKVVNDSLGHVIGDQLLVEIGRRLSSCLRPGDTVARLGGDEFAILLEIIRTPEDASEIAERIIRAFASAIVIDNHEIFVSNSIGITLKSDRYERPEQVLRDADIAMYEAKAKGKARYEFFNESMHSNIIERLQMEADLRVAIEHMEGFVLNYQPIIDVKPDKIDGFEALVRWEHPVHGSVLPMTFIPIAEETGMIHVLGEWIMGEACRQLKLWHDRYNDACPLKMSVNVSGKQFLKEGFAEFVIGVLKRTGIAPECLAIEITESIIMKNVDLARETMNTLRQYGVQIHIDDFGTGYSSLSYLHNFPVTALKIDKSFVSKMSVSEDHKEIVRTIIALAQNLNLKVIAEGVELLTQVMEIKDMDCQYAQGYHYSRPMTAADIDVMLEKRSGTDQKA